MSLTGCSNPLDTIAGTGFNHVSVPGPNTKGYTAIENQLLYEIWQTLLVIAGGSSGGMTVIPIVFTIGDGQADTPLNGTTSMHLATLQGQSLANKTLLVLRNGIQLAYSKGPSVNQISRFNDGTNGGFTFTVTSGLSFSNGDYYNIFVIGNNTTIE